MKYLLLFGFFVLTIAAKAQVDSTTPPYKRFPNVPPIKIMLSDSATIFTKANLSENKPVFMMMFSPDCSHCQHETEELIKHKDEMKDVQIVMITMHPMEKMKEFISKYKLSELPNVVIGRDYSFMLPAFFQMRNLPFLALYDKKGQLIGGFEGSLGITEVIQIFNSRK